MGQHCKEFTDANFESEVLKSDKPVLVDFWATWCGPCRQIAPMIEQLAGAMANEVVVGKLNIDDSPKVTEAHGIQSIPTLLLFQGGVCTGRIQPGSMDRMKAQIQASLT
ncbi:MAG: thioredoxin [Planctomycetota bacterium]